MMKAIFISALLVSAPVGAETLEGTVLDVRDLTRNVQVEVPYRVCDRVAKTVRFDNRGYMGYTDGPLKKIFDRITAPTGTVYVNECQTVHKTETQSVLDGYLVTYSLGGRFYHTRTKVRPQGDKINVRIRHEVQ